MKIRDRLYVLQVLTTEFLLTIFYRRFSLKATSSFNYKASQVVFRSHVFALYQLAAAAGQARSAQLGQL